MSTVCISCPAGTYSSAAATSCILCAGGNYNPTSESSACEKCPVGQLSKPSRTICETCGVGQYADGDKLECVDCPVGTYAPQALNACVSCPEGTIALAEKTSLCTTCVPGFYEQTPSTPCQPCPLGQFQGAPTQTQCLACPPGAYTASTGSTVCISCPPGFFGRDSVSCEPCLAGQFQDSQAQTKCVDCDPGYYESAQTSASCSGCALGYFAASASSSLCELCPPGKAQGAFAQAKCVPCPSGSSASEAGSSSCALCDEGSSSPRGARKCSLASLGFYRDDVDDKTSSIVACPDNSNNCFCPGNMSTPLPLKGFWVDRSDMAYLGVVYRCHRETCMGIDPQATRSRCWDVGAVVPVGSLTPSSCAQEELNQEMCSQGARGPLCASCGPGFVFSVASAACSPCSRANTYSISVIAVLVVVLIIVSLAFRYISPLRTKVTTVLGHLSDKIDRGALKVLFVTYQIVVTMVWTLEVPFPKNFRRMASTFSFISLDLFTPKCWSGGANPLSEVYLWSLFPIAFALLNGLVLAGRLLKNRASSDIVRSYLVQTHVTYFLLMSYCLLPPVVCKQFQALSCVEVGGKKYLRSDTSVSCEESGYKSFVVVDVFFILAYLAVPLAWGHFLYKARMRLNPPAADPEYALFLRDSDPAVKPLGFLFQVYKPQYFFWEMFEMSVIATFPIKFGPSDLICLHFADTGVYSS